MLAVTVIGNIGNDAEIKEFNGQKFIAFNVASTERYKDRQGNQHSRTTWVSCLKPGESSVVTYLKKGTQVYVRGSLSVKTFNSGNGVQAGVNCIVQPLILRRNGLNFTAEVEGHPVKLEDLARNDGLTPSEFAAWFIPVFDKAQETALTFAIIQFTTFRY